MFLGRAISVLTWRGNRKGGGRAELAAVELLARRAGPPANNEVWIGDDAAVLELPGKKCLFATDVTVEGIHFDRNIGSLADVGWRALVQNLSDLAAMGGAPHAAV